MNQILLEWSGCQKVGFILFTRAVKAGWKYWALVHSQTMLTNIVYDRISTLFSCAGVKVKVFFKAEEAMDCG
jgi:hypothetical protein